MNNDYNGDVFYRIFPIKNTPAESQVLIDMIANSTMNILTNGQEFEYTKTFIDDETLVQKKASPAGGVVREKLTVLISFFFAAIKCVIWSLTFYTRFKLKAVFFKCG